MRNLMREALFGGLVVCAQFVKLGLRPLVVAICLGFSGPILCDQQRPCAQRLELRAIPEDELQEWERVTLLAFEANDPHSSKQAESIEALVTWIHRRAGEVLDRRDEIEDIAQIAAMKTLNALPNFCGQGGNFKSWATTILTHTAIDFHRSRRFQAYALFDPQIPAPAPPPAEAMDHVRLPGKFRQAIRKYFATYVSIRGFLPREGTIERTNRLMDYGIFCDYLRGVPLAALGKRYEMPEATIKWRVQRQRQALVGYLQNTNLLSGDLDDQFATNLRKFFSDPAVYDDSHTSDNVRESIHDEFLVQTATGTTLNFWEIVYSLEKPLLNAIRLSILGMPLNQIAQSEGVSFDHERALLEEARRKVHVHLQGLDWIQRELPNGREFVLYSDYLSALQTLTPHQRKVFEKRMLGRRHDKRSFAGIQKRLLKHLSLRNHQTDHFVRDWIPFANSAENREKLWNEVEKLDPAIREIVTLRLHGTGAYDISRLVQRSRKEVDGILGGARLALLRTFFPSLKARGNAWLRKYLLHRYPKSFTPKRLLSVAKKTLSPKQYELVELKYLGFMNQVISEIAGFPNGNAVHNELRLIQGLLHKTVTKLLEQPVACPYPEGTAGNRLWKFILSEFPTQTLQDFWAVAKECLADTQFRFLKLLSNGASETRTRRILELSDHEEYRRLSFNTHRRLARALQPKRDTGAAWIDGVIACVEGGTRQAFWEALKLCPEHYQQAVKLKVKERRRNPEICKIMGIEYSQLQGVLYNAKIKIVELMAGRRTRPRTTVLHRPNLEE